MEHFTGAIKDPFDPRDYKLDNIAGDSSPFDWEKGYDVEQVLGIKIKVKDQGGSYSCGGQAWSYYGAVLKVALLGLPYEENSAKFIYAQTAEVGGGSGGRKNCDLVLKQGWGSEALTPSYQNGNAPTELFMTMISDITQAAREYAKKNQALSYATTELDIDSIAKACRDHYGTIIGITGENNGTWHSAFPVKPVKGDWNHWLYIGKVKLINGKRHLGALNSWGEGVGEQGWQWISEDYFTNQFIWSNWTIIPKKYISEIKPSHTFKKDMVYGNNNAEVKALQQCLIWEFKDDPTVELKAGLDTGYFGTKTLKAVMAFQVKYKKAILTAAGLGSPNGKVLKFTRAKLNELYSNE